MVVQGNSSTYKCKCCITGIKPSTGLIFVAAISLAVILVTGTLC